MGLFKKAASKPPAQPVRRDQVRRLIKLGMEESDAADRELSPDRPGDATPGFDEAKQRLESAYGQSTQAEMQAAHTALQRHGY